jgi:hypothetical protein
MSAPTAPLTPTVDGHTIPIGGTTIPALLPQTDILGPFIKAASAMAQQEIAVLKALPADKQQEQLTIRLGQLQMFGLLTPDEVATLQGLSAASRANAVIGAPPIITPDGSPSLCGFIGSALLRGRPNPVDQPQSDTNVPPGVDFQSILDNRWVGATLGGLTCAVVGGCMYGGPGALVGFSVGFTAVLM